MTATFTRRRFLGATAAAATLTTPADARGSNASQVFRQFVIPEVDAFEGNYVGQFVFVKQYSDDDAGEVPIQSCEFDTWSTDETAVYVGELLDRRAEAPVSVELPIYADSSKPEIEDGTHFIVQDTSQCEGEYLGVATEWIQRRALVGEPSGPTVTETGTGQPGFGLLAAAGGIGVGVLARALSRARGDDRSED